MNALETQTLNGLEQNHGWIVANMLVSSAQGRCQSESLCLRREVDDLSFLARLGREVSATLDLETTLSTSARLLYQNFRFNRMEFAFSELFGIPRTLYSALDEKGTAFRSSSCGKGRAPKVRGYRSIGLAEPKKKKGGGRDVHITLPGEGGSIILYSALLAGGGTDSFLTSVGEIVFFAVKNALAYRAIKELSHRDSLTGLFNRRMLEERLDLEKERCEPLPLAMMILDLDNFKKVNDNFGHPAGDRVLSVFGAILRKCCRDTDVVTRYGGEEFAVLLPDTTCEAAVKVAERLRRDLARQIFTFAGQQLRVTASIGIAATDTGKVVRDELLSQADQALYHAKQSGKDRVAVYGAGVVRGNSTAKNSAAELNVVYETVAA